MFIMLTDWYICPSSSSWWWWVHFHIFLAPMSNLYALEILSIIYDIILFFPLTNQSNTRLSCVQKRGWLNLYFAKRRYIHLQCLPIPMCSFLLLSPATTYLPTYEIFWLGSPNGFDFWHILNMVVYLTGTRAACINAATLALADAGIPMRDIVTSCSAGYLCSTPLLGMTLLYILSLERII